LLIDSRQSDLAAISLLVRTGHLRQASSLLDRVRASVPASPPVEELHWAADEIAEASGDAAAIERERRADVPWTKVMNGVRAFTYSETLANALRTQGNLSGAIDVLEKTGALHERVLTMSSHTGYFWMRDQVLLAELYRQTGRLSDARRIETALLRATVIGDSAEPKH